MSATTVRDALCVGLTVVLFTATLPLAVVVTLRAALLLALLAAVTIVALVALFCPSVRRWMAEFLTNGRGNGTRGG